MADETDLTSAIETTAAGPKSVTQDGASVTSQSVGDMIDADRYLAAKKLAKKGPMGLRGMFGRFKPPGAVG